MRKTVGGSQTSLWGTRTSAREAGERQKGLDMPDDHLPPKRPRQRTGGGHEKADDGLEAPGQDRGGAQEHVLSAESGRDEAERFRRLAEEAREVRDQHREALEIVRQQQEHLREAGETTRVAGEEARSAAESARQATLESVHATAESLESTLEGMKMVEEMRRALRYVRDVTGGGSN